MSVSVNGIAHIQLTVSDPGRCLPFWEKLCHFLDMQTLIKGDAVVYCIGGRTGILVRGAPREKRTGRFDQDRAGLHHLCFRARSREDVDAVHRFVVGENRRSCGDRRVVFNEDLVRVEIIEDYEVPDLGRVSNMGPPPPMEGCAQRGGRKIPSRQEKESGPHAD